MQIKEGQQQQQQKKKPQGQVFTEDFRKIRKSDAAVGIMKHKDGTIEKRKF